MIHYEFVHCKEYAITLTVLYNHAGMLDGLRRCREAEPVDERALTARKEFLGYDHDWTIDTWRALAMKYDSPGRCDETQLLRVRINPQAQLSNILHRRWHFDVGH